MGSGSGQLGSRGRGVYSKDLEMVWLMDPDATILIEGRKVWAKGHFLMHDLISCRCVGSH